MIGRTLAHYQITAKLGEGGMGEVYLAEDRELGREVAIKVLPAAMAGDPGWPERFEREARAIAALNHPNIVTVHAVGEVEGLRFLVMERIAGRSLDEEIPAGGYPLEEFFRIAVPLSDAVAAAHREGIVHRDLKPANLMVNEEGRLKVLDFGLAKKRREAGADGTGEITTLELTQKGSLLGTVPYMAPEQVQGKEADERSDIFSLGTIFFELLTGRRPFAGETQVDVASSILRDTPPAVTELRPELPRQLARIVRHCLEKDPRERLQSALDLRNELAGLEREIETARILEAETARAAAARALATRIPRRKTADLDVRRPDRTRLGVVLVVVSLLAVTAAWLAWRSGRRAAERPVESGQGQPARGASAVRTLAQLTFGAGVEDWAIWSPDGSDLVYAADSDGFSQLYRRPLAGGREVALTSGPRDSIQPSWSPDGQSLAFVRSNRESGRMSRSDVLGHYFEGGDIWKLDLATGVETLLVENAYSPTYSADGARLAFDAPWAATFRIWTADAAGRNPKQVSTDTTEGAVHVSPSYSPNGRFLVYRRIETTRSDLVLVDLTTQEQIRVTDDQYLDLDPAWSPSGDSVYFSSYRGGGLNIWRIGISPEGRPTAPPAQVTTGAGQDLRPQLSPDGSRLMFTVLQNNSDIWRLPVDPGSGLPTGAPEPLVATTREESRGAISPDGATLAFNSDRSGEMNLYLQSLDDGTVRQLTYGPGGDYQASWSPDGRRIAFFSSRSGNSDIWTVDVEGGDLRQITTDQGLDTNPSFSPDGGSIAFHSDRGGRLELWLVGADGSEERQLTSIGVAGHFVRWAPDGRNIIFRKRGANAHVIAAEGGPPTPLVQVRNSSHMSLSPDGSRIMDCEGHKALWVTPLETGQPVLVQEFDARIDYPVWSPDGRWVTFDVADPRGGDVWLLEGVDRRSGER